MDSLMIGTNLVLCLAGGLMIICRGRHMHPAKTRHSILLAYTVAMFAFSASAISWTFSGISELQVISALVADIYLLLSAKEWKNGQPWYAMR